MAVANKEQKLLFCVLVRFGSFVWLTLRIPIQLILFVEIPTSQPPFSSRWEEIDPFWRIS